MLEKGARLLAPAAERVPTRQIGLGPGREVASWTRVSFSIAARSSEVMIMEQGGVDRRDGNREIEENTGKRRGGLSVGEEWRDCVDETA